jgi:hypothetical protein
MSTTSSVNFPATEDESGYLRAIRSALLDLPATGPKGFEGLIAEVLTAACGRTYRLAASGSQGGRDGDGGNVYFEAKRYSGALKRPTVSDKLMELGRRDVGHIDLFVLAVTSQVNAQDAEFYKLGCQNIGLELLLLDWNSSSNSIPELAVFLTLAIDEVRQFFRRYHPARATEFNSAIGELAARGISRTQTDMLTALCNPLASLAHAREASQTWFKRVFASEAEARRHLYQPLAPFDNEGIQHRERAELSGALEQAFTSAPDGILWLLDGREGAGKSSLFASCWSSLTAPPVLAFVAAEDCRDSARLSDLDEFIARKLAVQTTRTSSNDAPHRWERRLRAWQQLEQPEQLRLVVYLDGVNQAPDVNWRRWIEGLIAYLKPIGGRLVVSSRPEFSQRIVETVGARVKRIVVPEWTELELSEILLKRGLNFSEIHAGVRDALRNPRLLSIAFEVLNNQEIRSLDELHPERLMFEYMNKAARDSAVQLESREFASALQGLAKEFVSRLQQDNRDDSHIFSEDFDSRIRAAADSRFFVPVPRESRRYSIHRDGLSLALGLWLISELEKELRNKREPAPHLESLIQPIAAFDYTADAIFAAVMVSFLDKKVSGRVGALLLSRYSFLQNRLPNEKEVLAGLARHNVDLLLDAAEFTLEDGLSPGEGIVGEVLSLIRLEESGWDKISSRIRTWLTIRSEAADTIGGDDEAERQARLKKRSDEYYERLRQLSHEERTLLHGRCVDQDVKPYHLLAFSLMRGHHLAPFAQELVIWSLGTSVLSSFYDLVAEFLQLVQHNLVDWEKTREALLRASLPLRRAGVSKSGKLAALRLLLATGSPVDAGEAEMLYSEIVEGRETGESWSLRENLCAVDPCDPSSSEPENIQETVERFREIEPKKLFQHMGNSNEGIIFGMALPAICRFSPALASEKFRALGADVLTRSGLPLRQGIQPLLAGSALLSEKFMPDLTELIVDCSNEEDHRTRIVPDAMLVQQFAMEIVLPHLDGGEQLKVFERLRNTQIARSAVTMLRPSSPSLVSNALECAIQMNDDVRKCNVLFYLAYSGTSIPAFLATRFSTLLGHSDMLVRAHALAIAARADDPALTKIVVESEWTARGLNNEKHSLEIHAGSRALAKACDQGFIAPRMALRRMSLSSFGLIARNGEEGLAAVAEAVNTALQRVLNLTDAPTLAEIKEGEVGDDDVIPPTLSVVIEQRRARDWLGEDGDDDWDEQQDSAWNSYFKFSSKLTDEDARLALDHLSQECVEALVCGYPLLVATWLDLIMRAEAASQRLIFQFWQQLSFAVAHVSNDAIPLLSMTALRPLTEVVRSYRVTSLNTWLLWRNAHITEIAQICFDRLDFAESDAEIAAEVMAAEDAGQSGALDQYVTNQLAIGHPVNLCRALMVSGFRDESPLAKKLLDQYKNAYGMVGEACTAASYAYVRNCWARHWFDLMMTESSNDEFWCKSRIFLKIVDSRYLLWLRDTNPASAGEKFFCTLHAELRHRLDKRDSSRRSKLFGGKRPWWLS